MQFSYSRGSQLDDILLEAKAFAATAADGVATFTYFGRRFTITARSNLAVIFCEFWNALGSVGPCEVNDRNPRLAPAVWAALDVQTRREVGGMLARLRAV